MHIPSERFKALREEKKLTQEELALELKCCKESIYRYEKNLSSINTYTLKQASVFLGVTTDYLLGLSEKKNNQENSYDYRKEILNDREKCKNCKLFYDENYYWITLGEDFIGGQTGWGGYADDGRDMRVLRPVIPERVIALCMNLRETPMIVNNERDCNAFLVLGGDALIRESMLKKYLPEYLAPL